MTKALRDLFTEVPFKYFPKALPVTEITGIAIDSRAVRPGNLFVAMRGGSADGHAYISKAIENGAGAIVGENDLAGQIANLPYIRVGDSRQSLTWLSAAFYDWPGRKLTVIGVTGTDGKTTTTNLIHTILTAAGIKAGMVSTVNAVIGNEILDTGFHVTTPDAQEVQGYLSRMVEAGITHVVLETTSHGWAQHRVDACEFDIGVVTNITHEHLDQHGSYENYRAAKARLIASLETTHPKPQGNPRLAVLNRDDSSFEFLNEIAHVNKLSYGLDQGADIQAVDLENSPSGVHFLLTGLNLRIAISSPMIGTFNISNCLAAFTATHFGLGITPQVAAQGIAAMESIPGRMERIELGQEFAVFVDFAHTPNALKVTLETAREMLDVPIMPREGNKVNGKTKGEEIENVKEKSRVIAILGSAGLRDKEKRKMMAEISTELADISIFTAEDPRTESLDSILAEMAVGARSKGGREGETFYLIPDRGQAIKFALSLARPGDVVLAFGKGHEQSMCFGGREHPWDDRVAMQAAIAEMLGVEGPKMPYLPTQDTPEEKWLKWR